MAVIITVSEPRTYEDYSALVDKFQKRMKEENHEKHEAMSNEREMGVAGVRRFVAKNQAGMVVGWMTLKTQDADLKIEGICTDPVKENSSGASKALITAAINCSLSVGKGGVVTLTNMSNGTGDSLYQYMGFRYIDENKMRLNIDWGNTEMWGVNDLGPKTTEQVWRGEKSDKLRIAQIFRK